MNKERNVITDLADIGVIGQVYSLVYPETRAVREELYNDPNTLEMHEHAYKGVGSNDHAIFLSNYKEWIAPIASISSKQFPYEYVGNGSSEPIREVIGKHIIDTLLSGGDPSFHVFNDEYQGYEAIVDAYSSSVPSKVRVLKHDRVDFEQMAGSLGKGSRIMLSQPSSINGNYWKEYDEFMKWLEQYFPEVPVSIDFAFAGATTNPDLINLNYPNIDNVIFSLSKTFGVYRDRTGGVFSKSEIPSLYGNRWFNNAFSLAMGNNLLASYRPSELPSKYASIQQEVVSSVVGILGEEVFASDVLLIANQPTQSSNPDVMSHFKRGAGTRFCLTPAIDRILKQ